MEALEPCDELLLEVTSSRVLRQRPVLQVSGCRAADAAIEAQPPARLGIEAKDENVVNAPCASRTHTRTRKFKISASPRGQEKINGAAILRTCVELSYQIDQQPEAFVVGVQENEL